MAVQEKQMTVEEFWAEYAGKPYELVEGRIVAVSPSGWLASEIALIIGSELRLFLKSNPMGRVTGADGGYTLGPNTMRAPDVGYVSNEKLATHTERVKYPPFGPDLAVEVVSPGNSATEIQHKVALYRAAGTRQVWVVYPELREVAVHHADGSGYTLGADDTLDGGELLPGFRLPVADLFPPEPTSPSA